MSGDTDAEEWWEAQRAGTDLPPWSELREATRKVARAAARQARHRTRRGPWRAQPPDTPTR